MLDAVVSNGGNGTRYDAWLADAVERFNQNNTPVEVSFRSLVPELKYGGDRYTHSIHPYPAKLIPAIPYLFLRCEELVAPGGVVLDPFCGTGTVLLEAALAGHYPIGSDANPLARLIAGAKLTVVEPDLIREHLSNITDATDVVGTVPDVVNIEHWFHPDVIARLGSLKARISSIGDESVRQFYEVCFSACVRRVSFADPRLSVPVRLNLDRRDIYGAKGDEAIRRLQNITGDHVEVAFGLICQQNLERMRRLQEVLANYASTPIYNDARNLPIASGSVDLVITSPPYAGAQKYVRASSLSLGWLGLAPGGKLRPLEKLSIGREHYARTEYVAPQTTSILAADEVLLRVRRLNPLRAHIASNYLLEMEIAISEMARVTRKGGHMVLVAGQNIVCGECFDTPAYLEAIAKKHGFRTQVAFLDDIRSRGLMTKRNKTASIICHEIVMVMKKNG